MQHSSRRDSTEKLQLALIVSQKTNSVMLLQTGLDFAPDATPRRSSKATADPLYKSMNCFQKLRHILEESGRARDQKSGTFLSPESGHVFVPEKRSTNIKMLLGGRFSSAFLNPKNGHVFTPRKRRRATEKCGRAANGIWHAVAPRRPTENIGLVQKKICHSKRKCTPTEPAATRGDGAMFVWRAPNNADTHM